MTATRLADGLVRQVSDSVDIQILPWDIEQVVSITGSFQFRPDHEAGEGLVADAACALLDKGTVHRSKMEISDALERVGASISFSMGGNRLRFGARCLVRDLRLVLSLLKEQVVSPAMPDAEFELLRNRFKAGLERQRSDTGAVARNEMSRYLYGTSHPDREHSFNELGTRLATMELERVRGFYASRPVFSDLKVAVVGDVGQWTPEDVAGILLNELPAVESSSMLSGGGDSQSILLPMSAQRSHIEIADRLNLNALFGHPVDVRTSDSDYLALWTAVFVLGGNFSSRLMSIIRDEKGLTYGINSSLSDMSADYGGSWKTAVTLSQEKLEEGVEATQVILQEFANDGITAAELDERKMTMIGSYEVQLATTAGIASRMHLNMLRQKPPSALDSHPEDVARLTIEDVNKAISTHLNPKELVLLTAGTGAQSESN